MPTLVFVLTDVKFVDILSQSHIFLAHEITKKDDINNELVKSLLSINGVEGIFLGRDFISVNKYTCDHSH